MNNLELMVASALLAVCHLAGCAGREHQTTREWQEHDTECHKFGAETGTPAYVDCRVALRAIESLIRAALPPPNSLPWHEAQILELSRDPGEQPQDEGHSHVGAADCSGVKAGVLDCGREIPLADLPAEFDP